MSYFVAFFVKMTVIPTSILIVAVRPGMAGCPEDEAAFLDCFQQFDAMEQSDTFWQQLCRYMYKNCKQLRPDGLGG